MANVITQKMWREWDARCALIKSSNVDLSKIRITTKPKEKRNKK